MRYIRALALFTFAFIICLPFKAFATFVEQIAVSTKAISLANTCTAYPPGLMSIHYNPAGLSQLPEGHVFEQGFTIPWIVKTSKFKTDPEWEGIFGEWGPQEGQEHDPVADTEDTNSSGVLYLPIYDDTVNFLAGPTAGLSSRKPGSRWTFAVGNYAPFAGGLNHKSDSPANYGGRTVVLQHLIYAAPAVSYQIHPKLSVGMSVGVGQTAMIARINMRSPNELVALTRVLGDATKDLEIPVISELTLPPPWFGGGIGPYEQIASFDLHVRDDFSPNYNLGMLWQPKDWLSFGSVYQSSIKTELTGGYNFRYEENWQRMMNWFGSSPLTLIISGMFLLPNQAVPYQSGTLTRDLEFPQRVQTGVMFKPTKRLRLMFDLNWADWSVIKEDNFQTDQDIQLLQMVKMLGYTGGHRNLIIKRNLKDTLHWGASMEYQLTKKLALRAGYEFRPTSIRDELYDLQYFIPDLHFIGTGVGVKLPHEISLDVALGVLFNPSYEVPNNGSRNLNSTDFFYPVYNPYAGLDFEQETYMYLASFTLQMPFHQFIEMQKDMMHKQQEAIHHLVGILNPFD